MSLSRFYRWACELLGLLEILPSSLMMKRLSWDHLVHVILRWLTNLNILIYKTPKTQAGTPQREQRWQTCVSDY